MSTASTEPEMVERVKSAALHRAASSRAARRRSAALLARDPALRATTSTKEDFACIGARAQSAAGLLAAMCERYADRPAIGDCAALDVAPVSYRALWSRVVALASGMHAAEALAPSARVGLYGFAGVDWVVADWTCVYAGATSVPLQLSASDDDLAFMIDETAVTTIVASAKYARGLRAAVTAVARVSTVVLIDLAALAPDERRALFAELAGWRAGLRVLGIDELEAKGAALAPTPPARPGEGAQPADPIVTISYTSGSTGRPKGVLYPDSRWTQRVREALAEAPMPYVTLGYLPLAQMGGRLSMLRALASGGTIFFAASTDLSSILDDARAIRPTLLLLIPRVSGLIHQSFQRMLIARGGSLDFPDVLATPAAVALMEEMRASFLGDRLCLVMTGAAPTAPETLEFLERCFDVSVINTYGATELGLVMQNGLVRPDIEFKLVDVPELGYRAADRPYPRGELWVKSPYRSPGYFNRESADRAATDADGYTCSGDIVEQRGPRQLAWIDRRNNVMRLAQGEFVSISRVEEALVTGGPYIRQAYVYCNPVRSFVLAVLVADEGALRERLGLDEHAPLEQRALRRALFEELQRIARAAGLRRHEVPRDFVLATEPFTRENGLLTESDKPRRPALKARYAAELEQRYEQIEARSLGDADGRDPEDASLEERVCRAALATLGLDRELGGAIASASFVALGGDSVNAIRFAELLRQRGLGDVPPVPSLLDPALRLADLAQRMASAPASDDPLSFERVHGNAPRRISASELSLERLLPDAFAAGAQLPLAQSPPRTVLLTGATGFLGRNLLLELLRAFDGEVVCIVRAPDEAAARARIRAGFAGPLGARLDAATAAGRVTVLCGDLSRAQLGLAEARYAALAGQLDAIVHCGALVNHALGYRDLYEANVRGAIELARLALTQRRKPFGYVSSIGIAAGLRRGEPIGEHEAARTLRTTFPLLDEYGVGYSASKWAGEVLVDELARAGVPVTIFRCGLLLAHRADPSQINDTDVLSRMLIGLARTGLAPASFYDAAGTGARHVDALPVDLVAAAIARAAVGAQAGVRVYHASNDRVGDGASWDRIADWIEAAGVPLARCASYEDWLVRFRAGLAALDAHERARSPLPILARWTRPSPGVAPSFDARGFRALVRDATAEDVPAIDAATVAHALRGLGLLSVPR